MQKQLSTLFSDSRKGIGRELENVGKTLEFPGTLLAICWRKTPLGRRYSSSRILRVRMGANMRAIWLQMERSAAMVGLR
jgi:hypothetical protein